MSTITPGVILKYTKDEKIIDTAGSLEESSEPIGSVADISGRIGDNPERIFEFVQIFNQFPIAFETTYFDEVGIMNLEKLGGVVSS